MKPLDPINTVPKSSPIIGYPLLPSLARLAQQTHAHSTLEEGCRVHGEIRVRRVPGYFLLEADSTVDSLEPSMTNVSHKVNHLFFTGDRIAMRDYIKNTAREVTNDILINVQPLRAESFVTYKQHSAPQHFLNVIPTVFDEKVKNLAFFRLFFFWACERHIVALRAGDGLSIDGAKPFSRRRRYRGARSTFPICI